MPDILIQDMKMPSKGCLRCPFNLYYANAVYCNCMIIKLLGKLSEAKYPNEVNCPLHELPAHGDLIDRDEVVNLIDYYEAHFANFHSPKTFVFMQDQAFDVMRRIIKKAVAVVPAKEETKNAN